MYTVHCTYTVQAFTLYTVQALQKNSTEERVVQIGIIARGDKCARYYN